MAIYPLDTKHRTYSVSDYNVPPGRILKVQLADGWDRKAGGSYYFKGAADNYIEIANHRQPYTRSAITLLAMIYPEESKGPIVEYYDARQSQSTKGVHLWICCSNTRTLFWRPQKRGPVEVSCSRIESEGT